MRENRVWKCLSTSAKDLVETFTPFAVDVADGAAQLGDGGAQLILLAADASNARFHLLRLDGRAQIHRPHLLPLLGQAVEPAAGAFFGLGRQVGGWRAADSGWRPASPECALRRCPQA